MLDVLVVGGGLAGAIAALVARQKGASVGLSSRSWGATAMSTGALDIAYTPALSPVQRTPRTLTDHIKDIIAHRPRHPYGVLGLTVTESGLSQGYDVLLNALAGTGLDLPPLSMAQENSGLASSLGTVLPAATAFASHRGLPLREPGRWGVLQMAGDAYFDAGRLARGIAHDALAFYGSSPELVPVPLRFSGHGPSLARARALDDRAVVDALASELVVKAKGLSGLLVPPVLGLARHQDVRRWLSEATGMPVVEALAHLPSVPGVRFQLALEAALKAAGVARVDEVVAPRTDGQRVTSVVTRDGLELTASAYVLASGRFIAGGLTWTDHCREALFDLPVVTELGLLEADSPHKIVRAKPVESHPLMTAGIKVNRQLQPIREARVAYTNVFAAGMIIGGFASRYALCADGVALATGFLAGQAAAAMRGEVP